jgi:polyferredoxin
MRVLVIGFLFWIFIVPSLVASFLFLTALAAFVPPLYFALTWFALAFTTALLLSGPFGLIPSTPLARFRSDSFQFSCQKTNPSQEKNNEAHHDVAVLSR